MFDAAALATVVSLRAATGCVAWKHVAAFAIAGTHAGDGLGGTFETTIDARDGRSVSWWHSGDLTSADGYDGSLPWNRDFSEGTLVRNAPSARARAVTRAWMDSRSWCDANTDVRYRAMGSADGTAGGIDDVLLVKPAGGAAILLFVDRASGLLDRTLSRDDENSEVAYFSDWRTVANVAIPFKVRNVDPEDNDAETDTVRKIAVLARVDAATFAPPPSAPHATLPRGTAAVTVPYTLEGDKVIVGVKLDGKGPFPFVVDTGGHFIVTAQTARRVGLSGRGSASSTDAHAVAQVGFVRVKRLEIGSAVIAGDVAEINPYGYAKIERGPRPPKAGWLGRELFERFAVTFDPRAQTMTMRLLDAPRPAPAGTRAALTFDEDSPLVACSIDAKPGVCMLDTGNASTTIVAERWARRSGLAAVLARGLDVGDAQRVSRADVTLGPFARPGELVSYAPVNTPYAELFTVEAAVISEALIGGFVSTFDYARSAVWLTPAGSYAPRTFTRTGVLASKLPSGAFEVRVVIAGSPAAQAGIRPGDVIVSVDRIPSSQLSAADFARINAAPKPTTITYAIAQAGATRRTTLTMRTLL